MQISVYIESADVPKFLSGEQVMAYPSGDMGVKYEFKLDLKEIRLEPAKGMLIKNFFIVQRREV